MFAIGPMELVLALVLGTVCIALPIVVFGFVGWMLVRANQKLDQNQEMIQQPEGNNGLRKQLHDEES